MNKYIQSELSEMSIFQRLNLAKRNSATTAASFRERLTAIFDHRWFAAQYRDLLRDRTDYLEFFLEHRLERGLAPNPMFDGGWYLHNHPDLHGKVSDALDHYLTYGARERRDPSPLFHAKFYCDLYDLKDSSIDPLAHYTQVNPISFPNPIFDGAWYMEHYPDVAATGLTPIAHFVLYGAKRRYDPNPMFNTQWYCSTFQEVENAGLNPLYHYLNGADRQGYDPSPHFNSVDYLYKNMDVFEQKVNALAHYLTNGFDENRPIIPSRHGKRT